MGLNRTPLFPAHQKLGARLIDFGGWEMPVQYTSIVEEHLAVRKAAGIFDISHMGEVLVQGPPPAFSTSRTWAKSP
jgi:aminomethyltransferase